jgi:predicted nuclease of restriction endonuclease-like (RecB) superfamily
MTQITQYQPFLEQILTKIQSARYEMLKTVSKQTVELYWEIGKSVSQQMQDQGWGKSIVEQLSKDLQIEFPGIKGFSARNLWNMKNFYEFYTKNKKLQPLVAEIGWTQNCIILEKCKDIHRIEYYLKKTKQMGWSKLDLIDKIKNHHFENQALAQNNFNTTTLDKLKAQVAWEFVDDYNIELISPDQPFSEKEIENTIVTNVVNFLADMGGSFAFVGRQYRLTIEEKEYFIDLLFFNFKLNCYIVFELKAREFQPKDMGQVQMYMQLINKQVKQEQHNRTIGIVICKDKNRTEVEYMLEQAKDPIGVATYNKYENLPKEYAKYLPSEEAIIKRLSNINF